MGDSNKCEINVNNIFVSQQCKQSDPTYMRPWFTEEKRLIFEHEFAQERAAIEREIKKAEQLEAQEAAEARLKNVHCNANILNVFES